MDIVGIMEYLSWLWSLRYIVESDFKIIIALIKWECGDWLNIFMKVINKFNWTI